MGAWRSTVAISALAVVVGLTGCGGSGETDDADGAAPNSAEAAADDAPEPAATDTGSGDGDATGTWCDWLDTSEVEGMFGGVLELADQRPVLETSCQWTIVGAEGEGLLTTEVTPGTAALLLEQGQSQSMPLEEPDLGDGAVLLNDADLTVIRADGTEFRIAISAFFTDAPVPDAAAVRAGILALGAAILEGTA